MKVEKPNKDQPSECRYCKAQIIWALTELGKRMPVDVQPHPKGKLIVYTELDFTGHPVDPNVHRVRHEATTDQPGTRWICHFATCPARHRQPNDQ